MRVFRWTPVAEKYLRKLPLKIQAQIQEKIESLREDPFFGTIALRDWQEVRRLRSGDWRILFRVTDEAIHILAIGPRGDIYK